MFKYTLSSRPDSPGLTAAMEALPRFVDHFEDFAAGFFTLF
jgi:hypothetical protein